LSETPGRGSGAAPGPTFRDRNPWWIPLPLGRMPDLPPRQVRMLGVIALALLFENYDQAMLTAALKQIAETFSVRESDVAGLLGWVHIGSIPAFFVIPFADRIGRRRLFLASMIVLGLATFAAAFAQNVNQFIALQMISRTFMVTTSATAFVMVTEEFPAAHRGWGIGILGALGSLGYGLGLLLFAGIDYLPYGWRAMYIVGITPIALLPMFRREVRETRRFDVLRNARTDGDDPARGWWRPFAILLRRYPLRTLAIGVIGATSSAGRSAAFQFSAYFVQAEHGWLPGQYTAMAVVAGVVGIIGHPYAGRLADRRGRRSVGFALFAAFPLLAYAFYHAPGWTLPLLWVPLIFALTGGDTIQRALATELFPTSSRGTASGWMLLCEAAGRSAGLFLVAWGTPDGASNTPMICAVSGFCLIAALLVWWLPETGRRELESISGSPDDR
jgi:MFS family permease